MITRAQLIEKIQQAFDSQADVVVSPEAARQQIAVDLGNAFADYVDGRTTVVTGTSATGGPVTGTGIIQGS